jgi:hypothetical protein
METEAQKKGAARESGALLGKLTARGISRALSVQCYFTTL